MQIHYEEHLKLIGLIIIDVYTPHCAAQTTDI